MSYSEMPRTLHLVRGKEVLGTIEVKPGEADYPWFSGAFQPNPEFEAVRELFDRELRLLRANKNDDSAQWDDWEAVHEELVEPGLKLQEADGPYVAEEILIHIDGGEAWWRTEETN